MKIRAPEVIQTSAMDCGPASLKCLLEGFGVSVSYGRLREACQTDVDGTSIDTLEGIAPQLGLDVEQVMLPPDHVLEPDAHALPAIAVVRLPNGFTHFVVVWRRYGPWVQIMDPASGRKHVTRAHLLSGLYVHTMPVPAEGWREWAASGEFIEVLGRRLRRIGVPDGRAQIDAALADPSWRAIAALDAATRMASSLVRSDGLRKGPEVTRVFSRLLRRSLEAGDHEAIPDHFWIVRPGPPAEDGAEQLLLRGAVLLRAKGRRSTREAATSPALEASLRERPSRPGLELLRLLRADGVVTPLALLIALAVAACGVGLEALLFRGLFDTGRYLALWPQRLGAFAALIVLLVALLSLELPIVSAVAGLGRRLEVRLRVAFLAKIPLLGDRYFHSRPTSDLAERSHSIHQVRNLPQLGRQLLQSVLEMAATVVGLAWLYPPGAWIATGAALGSLLVSVLAQQPLTERDLRVRVHAGGLARFYLDALLGLIAIRTHAAERVLRDEHEALLVDWARANRAKARVAIGVDAFQALLGVGVSAGLVFGFLRTTFDVGNALLLVYWALNLPALGQDVAATVRQVPVLRNLTLRLLEPLGATEEGNEADEDLATTAPEGGVELKLERLSVLASGHTILQDIDLVVPAGSHVAIVGPSGAGKSSLVGLLLGWHRPSTGHVYGDGRRLDGDGLAALRRQTAWVDPAVQLWNRPLIDNMLYGADAAGPSPAIILDAADLRRLLEHLPDGLQTSLGESGGLVSGGEGQRVRFARALRRKSARLVILDEPFRGLDRKTRHTLLERARAWWPCATLLCITHDVAETRAFPRVLVIEGGRVVEDGAPAELAAAATRYRAMLESEDAVRTQLWSSAGWRHVELDGGRCHAGKR